MQIKSNYKCNEPAVDYYKLETIWFQIFRICEVLENSAQVAAVGSETEITFQVHDSSSESLLH